MKKILTLFALLIAFAVNGFADNWYVVGDLTSWTFKPSESITPMTFDDTKNIYYADFTSISGKKYFCIADGDGTDWGNFHSQHRYATEEPEYAVPTDGTPVTLGIYGETNLTLTGDGSNYRLEFNSETKALTVTKSEAPAPVYSIVGDFSSWADDLDMTQSTTDENVYTLETSVVVTNTKLTYEYKLRTNHAWGGLEIPASGNDSYTFPAAGTYNLKFTANISENTLTLVATTTAADASTIPGTEFWSNATPKVMGNWSASNAVVLDATKFENVHVGDVLHVALEGIAINPASSYSAQVSFRANTTDWPNVEDDVPVGKGDKTYASIVITGDILKMAKQYGLVIFGHDYSTKLIKLETGVYSGTENSIWLGNQTLTWTQAKVDKCHFVNANVQAGQFIKLTYAKTGDPNIQLRYGWGEEDTYGTPTYGDGAAILEVTDAMLENLKTKDELIVNAAGIRLTQIELLSLNNYYVIYDKNDGNGWKVDTTPMIPDEGIPTSYMKAISDVKYFAIAPDIALNAAADGINLWPLVIRPVTESGNFVVALKDYADKTTTGTDNVWEVSGLNTATITYTPGSTGETDYTITNCIADIVVTNAAGWATYSNANPYLLSILPETGEMVYIVTGVENGEVVLKKLTDATDGVVSIYVPGGTGVLIKGDNDPEDDIICANPAPANATFANVTGNWLIGSNDYTYVITNDGYTAYILAKPENKEVGFYKAALTNDDKTIAAHKAFLAVPTTGPAPEFILIGGGDGTTGINATINDTVNDNAIFDLSGRRVENPTKGIYIVNGKKVVIK